VPSGSRAAGARAPASVLNAKLAARQKWTPWAVMFVILSVMTYVMLAGVAVRSWNSKVVGALGR
jgi:hypothetical protein